MASLSYTEVIRQIQIRQNLRNIISRNLECEQKYSESEAVCRSLFEIQVKMSSVMIKINDHYRTELVQLEKEIIEAQITYGSGSTNGFLEKFKKEKEEIKTKTAELTADINQGVINQRIITNYVQFFHESIPSEYEQNKLESDMAQLTIEINQLVQQKELIERHIRINEEQYTIYPEE